MADGSKSKAAAAIGGGVETSAAAAGRRRTKLVKVDQGIIDYLLERPKVMEDIIDGFAGPTIFDALAEVLVDDPEVLEMRAEHADSMAFYRKVNDVYQGILAQYNAKGYAMVEVEVKDDGSESLLCMQ